MDLAIGELYKVGSNWEHLVNQQPTLLPQETLRYLLTWGMFLPPITLESHQGFRLPTSFQDGICKIKKGKKYYRRDGLVSLNGKIKEKISGCRNCHMLRDLETYQPNATCGSRMHSRKSNWKKTVYYQTAWTISTLTGCNDIKELLRHANVIKVIL